jgi:hypothetical protein
MNIIISSLFILWVFGYKLVIEHNITTEKKYENFRSRRWGSSLTVCARLLVRSSPHRQERKFSAARVCRVTFKHL